MNKVAVFSLKYYLNDKQLDFTQIDNIEKKASDIEILEKCLEGVNTRLIDRQSMALGAAIRSIENEEFYKKIDKSKISVVVGSLSAAVYPIFDYALSAIENGLNFVNPTFFPNTVANAPASRLCIWNQFKNQVVCLSEGKSSGIDAVMLASEQISEGDSKYAWAGASEENGAALMLLGKEQNLNIKPLAYIKNYESRYVGNLLEEQKESFIKKKLFEWNVDEKKDKIIMSQNSALFSLEPMIDIGKSLIEISQNKISSSVIISIDNMGILSILELGRS